MLNMLIGPIANVASTWIEGKQKKAEAKAKLEVAKVEATVKRVEQDADWEASAMSSSDNSWKDEAWTICFIALIIASTNKGVKVNLIPVFCWNATLCLFLHCTSPVTSTSAKVVTWAEVCLERTMCSEIIFRIRSILIISTSPLGLLETSS